MKYLSHVSDDLLNFFNLEEYQRDELIDTVKKITDEGEKEILIEEIRNDFPQINFSGLGTIYEALADNPKKWGDFYVAEFKRAYLSAETAENPFIILNCLEELTLIENKNKPFGHEIIEFLTTYLHHSKAVFRYKAVYHLGDWLEDGNEIRFRELIYEIQKKLEDENWKVRHIAELALMDLDAVPKKYTPTLFDKMQRKFSNPFQF